MKFAAICCLGAAGFLNAQQFVISTYAGGAPPPTPIAALNASVGLPQSVATDANGNLYFVSLNCVFKVDPSGTLTRIAGNSRAGYSGDNGPAVNAQLYLLDPYADDEIDYNYPAGLVVDNLGNVYVTDTGNYRVRKISPAGMITTVAGGGDNYPGDGGPATSARLGYPSGLAIDTKGNLFISDVNRVRKISPDGNIVTVAGDGSFGGSGDGGAATSAKLNGPAGIAVDRSGNLYIADVWNHRIRKVSPNGIISTVAGNGIAGDSGDGGPALSAQINVPVALVVDTTGNLYIGEDNSSSLFTNDVIRRITSGGIISTFSGGASLQPWGLTFDSVGNLYIAGGGNSIRKMAPDGSVTTVAGNGGYSSGDGGSAVSAQFNFPQHLATDNAGNLYVSDFADARVRKVSASGIVTTVAGTGTRGYSGDGGPATNAQVSPAGLAVDGGGSLYIADNYRVRKVSPDGTISTIAGNGNFGYSGDGGPAIDAQLSSLGLTIDTNGNLYISDVANNRIRKVSPAGIITTVAGNGSFGSSGDGGPASSAPLNNPSGLAIDAAGNLYIGEAPARRVRKVSTTGIITTIAGSDSSSIFFGDGGPATSAGLSSVDGLTLDSSGNLYIADTANGRVRMVSPGGIITTVAGIGARYGDGSLGAIYGYSGDGGPAANASLNPHGLAIDGAGNIYVSDSQNKTVRLLQSVRPVSISAVLNAASNLPGPIAPGEIVVISGSGLGPAHLVSAVPGGDSQYATQLAGTAVLINDIPAPLVYTSATQVAAIVPDSVSSGMAMVTVSYQGQAPASVPVAVAAAAPGIFTADASGRGHAVTINQDGLIDAAANGGDTITLFVTGVGHATSGELIVYPDDPFAGTMPITFSSPQGGVGGIVQFTMNILSGQDCDMPFVIRVGDSSSQAGVTISIRICI